MSYRHELQWRLAFILNPKNRRRTWDPEAAETYRRMISASCGTELRDAIARARVSATTINARNGEYVGFVERNLTIELNHHIQNSSSVSKAIPFSMPLDDRRILNRDWRLIRAELLHALRMIISSSGEYDDDDEEWSREKKVAITQRFWHYTVYWLCEIMGMLCERFTLTIPLSPLKYSPCYLSYDEYLSDGYAALTETDTFVAIWIIVNGSIHDRDKWTKIENISRWRRGIRWAAFRWRFAALQRDVTSVRCRGCVQRMLLQLAITVERITNDWDDEDNDNAAITIIAVVSEYARLYQRSMSRATSSCGPRHDAAIVFNDYQRRDFPYTIRVHLPRRVKDFVRVAPHQDVIVDGSRCLRAIARFAREVVTRAPWYTRALKCSSWQWHHDDAKNDSNVMTTLDISMPESFFDVSHRLPIIMPRLFDAWSGMQISIVYDNDRIGGMITQ